MGRTFSVKFRGEEHDIEVTRDGGYEPDTGAHDMEWKFVEGGIGKDMTCDEAGDIREQIYAVITDPHYHGDESDWR